MKTKRDLLEFLLKELGLWKAFEKEVNAGMDLPSWDNTDDDLERLLAAISRLQPNDWCYRVANRLTDKTFLKRLDANEDVTKLTQVYALSDLCEYAGLDNQEPRVWDYLPDDASIMDIVEKVYAVAEDE